MVFAGFLAAAGIRDLSHFRLAGGTGSGAGVPAVHPDDGGKGFRVPADGCAALRGLGGGELSAGGGEFQGLPGASEAVFREFSGGKRKVEASDFSYGGSFRAFHRHEPGTGIFTGGAPSAVRRGAA